MISNYANLMAELEQQFGLPSGLLGGIANAETGHINDWGSRISATSPKGARGLMQFMPATAKQYGVDPLDPESAIRGAAKYLADARDVIKSNDPALLAAAYNAGPAHKSLRHGQIPDFAETQAYVPRVLKSMGVGGDFNPTQVAQNNGSTPFTPSGGLIQMLTGNKVAPGEASPIVAYAKDFGARTWEGALKAAGEDPTLPNFGGRTVDKMLKVNAQQSDPTLLNDGTGVGPMPEAPRSTAMAQAAHKVGLSALKDHKEEDISKRGLHMTIADLMAWMRSMS